MLQHQDWWLDNSPQIGGQVEGGDSSFGDPTRSLFGTIALTEQTWRLDFLKRGSQGRFGGILI